MTSLRAALAVLVVVCRSPRCLSITTAAILAVVMLFVSPRAADAQEAAKVWRVEVLANAALESSFEGFRDGLRALGYVEGRDLIINVTSSPQFERLPDLALRSDSRFRRHCCCGPTK